jgi:AraC-like DNA-binding protein/CheY-like chemotaxis protein
MQLKRHSSMSASMQPTLMWFDLNLEPWDNAELFRQLSAFCRTISCRDLDAVGRQVLEHKPNVICFDFDYPDITRLEALRTVKEAFPSIPILLVTLQSSEALLLWAFRTGVRDCLIKPVGNAEIAERIETLLGLSAGVPDQGLQRKRRNGVRPGQLPLHARSSRDLRQKRTQSAVNFMKAHLHEKIALETVAALCHLGVFSFARVFKREHGLSFSEMLGKLRIEYAMGLLRNPALSIADVAWSSGFHDTSYFARAFRKYAGVTPTQFRDGVPLPAELGVAANDARGGLADAAGES